MDKFLKVYLVIWMTLMSFTLAWAAGTKISDATHDESVGGSETIPVDDAGTGKYMTVDELLGRIPGLYAWFNSINGVTETNGGILYGTADNAYAWLAAGTSGYLLQGNGAGAPSWINNPTLSGILTDTAGQIISHKAHDTAATTPYFDFRRERDGDPTQDVSSGDYLGELRFRGYHTDGYYEAAIIRGVTDGTGGSADMPGRIEFATSADGSATPTLRWKLDSSGDGYFGDGGSTNYVKISSAGVVTFVGTGDIDLPNDSVDIEDLNIANLETINGLTAAEGKIMVGDSDPKWSLSAFKVPAPSTSGNIMKSDGTDWTSSNTLNVANLDMTSSTSSIPCPVGTAAAPTDEGKFYWNSTNDALTVGTGAAAKVFIGEGAATGGLLFGDSTPDAAGEVGYDSGKFGFYGANSEDVYINVGSAANTVTVGTNTGVTDLSLGAINLLTTGTIAGRVPIGSDITGNISLNTTDLIGKVYFVTAACTITLDKVSDVGFGAVVGFYVRDVSETVIIEIDDADKIKLYGKALDAGDTIDSPGAAGDYIFLMSVTDADGSGTDGWVTFGGSGTWKDGGAT